MGINASGTVIFPCQTGVYSADRQDRRKVRCSDDLSDEAGSPFGTDWGLCLGLGWSGKADRLHGLGRSRGSRVSRNPKTERDCRKDRGWDQDRGETRGGELVDGKVIPRNAVLSGEVIASAGKTGTEPSRLGIRIHSATWKGGTAPVTAYLTAWVTHRRMRPGRISNTDQSNLPPPSGTAAASIPARMNVPTSPSLRRTRTKAERCPIQRPLPPPTVGSP